MSRIVAVFGATGTQGSAVVNALLEDKVFVPRAITRNASSDAAKALAARGAEVVTGDLWDRESIKKALAGCEAVFGVSLFGGSNLSGAHLIASQVTNYNDPSIAGGDTAGEIVQGKQLIDVAKEVGIKFFVWSSLPNSTKLSGGKYPGIHHFDNKAAVEDYLRASGLPNATVQTGWFAENVINYPFVFGKGEGEAYEIKIPLFGPTKTIALLWVEHELGQSVLALLKHYQDRADEVLNKTFYVANAQITFPEFAEVLSKAIGKPVEVVSPPTTGVKELDIMNAYASDIGLYRDVVLPDPRLVALGVKFATIEDFAQERAKPRFA
ncbi:hypothetical protein HWV62_15771 [Athelia sp. TMB]|nr:hypothetical protein HWV62_15771 [Athelia sp. TMB]